MQKFIQDPYSATLGGFSKVTHFLRDTLLTPERHDSELIAEESVSNLQEEDVVTDSDFEIVSAVSEKKTGDETELFFVLLLMTMLVIISVENRRVGFTVVGNKYLSIMG
jgi:hypothetical protein